MSVKLGINFFSWLIMFMNFCSFVIFLGVGNWLIVFVFFGFVWIFWVSIMCFRNLSFF